MSVSVTTVRSSQKKVEGSDDGTLTVLFCALPTCGHCLVMKPIYRELANEFQCCKVNLLEVDFSKEPRNGKDIGDWLHKPVPNGFPTFYAFNGKQYKAMRQGSSTKDAFRKWMLEQGLDCSMCAPGTR
jgi:hypothetical protein